MIDKQERYENIWDMSPKKRRARLLHGVGVADLGPVSQTIEGKSVTHRSYRLWAGMLQRCYCPKWHQRRPTYIGCRADESWLTLSNFHKDVSAMHGYDRKGWHLDKDLLGNGKLYSAGTCVFVPSQINSLLGDCGAKRGAFPSGVKWHKRDSRFLVSVAEDGKLQTGTQKSFTDIEDATEYAINLKREIALRGIDKYLSDHPQHQLLAVAILNQLDGRAAEQRAQAEQCQNLHDCGVSFLFQQKITGPRLTLVA